MKNRLLIILWIVVWANLPFHLFAQTNCNEQIANAEKVYEEGRYGKSIELLKNIVKECNLKGKKKLEVYKYLAAANYELDELEVADEYISYFLRKNPYYEANINNDPNAFIQQLENYKKWPRLKFGISGGIPFTQIMVDKIYPVMDTALVNYNQDFSSKSADFASFHISYNINQYLSIASGVSYRQQLISQKIPMFSGVYFNYSENITEFSFPAYLKFSVPIKQFIPSIYFGGEYIISNDASYSYGYSENGNFDQKYEFLLVQRKQSNVPINLSNNRNAQRYAAIGGIRLGYQLKNIILFADVKYKKELVPYTNKESYYANTELFITNNYIVPDIRFNSYEVSIGFTYSLFYKVKSKY